MRSRRSTSRSSANRRDRERVGSSFRSSPSECAAVSTTWVVPRERKAAGRDPLAYAPAVLQTPADERVRSAVGPPARVEGLPAYGPAPTGVSGGEGELHDGPEPPRSALGLRSRR